MDFDHSYKLSYENKIQLAAKARSQKNKIVLEVWTNQPSVHFYTGNYLEGTIGAT